MPFGAATSHLRPRDGREYDHGKVAFVELFFDLVFVFAITQLSHALLTHATPLGTFEVALLYMAIWIVWVDTCWCTNWLDPQHVPVRLMLFALMLAALIMSVSIPQAFASRGYGFGGTVAAIQVGRCLFMLWALRRHSPRNFANFRRITVWRAASGVLWIAGAFASPQLRIVIWSLAVFTDYLAPAVNFWVPKLGRSEVSDWNVEGGHMAERCGLFIIIALGESILVMGTGFAGAAITAPRVAAFVVAFIASVAMWWIYFNIGAERGRDKIEHEHDPGRLARLAYTYLHLPVGAGIIVAAVGDELVLSRPAGDINLQTAAALLGGAALYLAGNIAFKRTLYGFMPLSHLIGIGALAVLLLAVPVFAPLGLAAAVALVLVVVAVWETWSLRPHQK
jgi:low temperature requirement protein LtrA